MTLSTLIELQHDVIDADPPWPFDLYSNKGNHKSPEHHYRVMPIEEIAAMPVHRLARGDAILCLWVTAPRLAEGLEVMKAWGFAYRTNVVWRKVTKNGLPRMGTGYWARTMHEQILIGTLGHPSKVRALPSCFDGVAREHSRKPVEWYELVERCLAPVRPLRLFCREPRAGWTSWGDETGKFGISPADDPPPQGERDPHHPPQAAAVPPVSGGLAL
jgi:N6-adenosine-specific RNA methylase IME4